MGFVVHERRLLWRGRTFRTRWWRRVMDDEFLGRCFWSSVDDGIFEGDFFQGCTTTGFSVWFKGDFNDDVRETFRWTGIDDDNCVSLVLFLIHDNLRLLSLVEICLCRILFLVIKPINPIL
jgi:hypothetical protein